MKIGRWLTVLIMLAPTLVSADEFADFRIPDHRFEVWKASLSGSAQRTRQGDATFESKSSSTGASTGTSFLWIHDSELRRTEVSAQGAFSANRYESTAKGNTFGDTRNWQHSGTESVRGEALQRSYLGQAPLAIEASIMARGDDDQQWFRQRTTSEDAPGLEFQERASGSSWDYRYDASAAVGIGVGRVRDATALYDARILEQRLRDRGLLRNDLAPATRRRLAELLYLRADYQTVLELPGKSFWSELQSILESDSALTAPLNAPAVLRALEIYGDRHGSDYSGLPAGSPMLRQRGAFAQLEIQASHRHSIFRSESERFAFAAVNDSVIGSTHDAFHTRREVSQDLILFGPNLEYHLPGGLRWQTDLSSQLLFSSKDPKRKYRWSSRASEGWILADRWLATATIGHDRDLASVDPTGIGTWRVFYSASLIWYLEDRFGLQLSTFGTQSRNRRPGDYEGNDAIYLSMSYKLSGRIDAPGLIEPVHVH